MNKTFEPDMLPIMQTVWIIGTFITGFVFLYAFANARRLFSVGGAAFCWMVALPMPTSGAKYVEAVMPFFVGLLVICFLLDMFVPRQKNKPTKTNA